ncbi:MFS transporter [Thiosocius teredinicola]|uniref:MFS transporter n=1 Tax=Thiosocius teredinicola TaxID=1973002 RepID=UPI0009914916
MADTLPAGRRSQWSWALYDWANSAFATTVMAGFFPVFFKSYWSADVSVTESTARLGTANAIASLLVMLLAPLLGVIADRSGRKKGLLLMLTTLGVLMSAGLFLVAEGYWLVAAGLYVFGVVGFAGANVTYDAMLLDVAAKDEVERVSALGYALGYLGGGLLFTVNVLMVLYPQSFGLADKAESVRLAFLMVAIWWAVFSLPVMLYVHEQGHATTRDGRGLRQAWAELVATWRLLRSLPMAFTFLLAYWCYIDGVDTIVRMAVDYGMSLGFAAEGLLTALLITQFVGFPAALVFGRIGDRIGAKHAIWLALVVYVIVVFWASQMRAEWEFYGLAVVIGLVQGGIQAMSRALYARLIPTEHAGRLFGLYNMMGKFAAVVGPLLVGWVAVLSDSARMGILSVLLLFVAGGWLLGRVDVRAGQRAAAEWEG